MQLNVTFSFNYESLKKENSHKYRLTFKSKVKGFKCDDARFT